MRLLVKQKIIVKKHYSYYNISVSLIMTVWRENAVESW